MQLKMILWGLCFMLFAYRGAQGKFHQRAANMQALETHRAGDLDDIRFERKIATLETKVTKLEAQLSRESISHETCCKRGDPKCLKYKGTKSFTRSGKKCQGWDRDWPHTHTIPASKFDAGVFETNYCRNPNESGSSDGAWCYTTDPQTRWESCGIPTCSPAKAHCQVGHTYFGGEEKDYWIKQEGQFIGDSVYGQGWTKTITQSFSSFKERPTFVASISSFVQNKESTSDKSLGILIKVKAVTTSNATIEVEAFDKKMERVQVTWFACDNNDDNDNNDDDDN